MAIVAAGIVLGKTAKFVGSSVLGPSRDEVGKLGPVNKRLASTLNAIDAVGHTGEAILALTTGGAFDVAALAYGGGKYALGLGLRLVGWKELGQAFHRSGKLTISAAGLSLVTGGLARVLPINSVASILAFGPPVVHGTAALVATKNVARYEGKI